MTTALGTIGHEAKYDSESSLDFFSGAPKDEQKSSHHQVKSPPLTQSTLPAFGTEFNTATYKTPFDSPDPILNGETIAASNPPFDNDPFGVSQPGAPNSIPTEKPTSFNMDAYAPANIFHTVPHQQQTVEKPAVKKSHSMRTEKHSNAASSSSSTQHAPKPRVFDPVEEAIIPEILSSRELLARRASEPTLGSRRAALAAAQAAAAAAAAAQREGQEGIPNTQYPASQASTPRKQNRSLHVDTSEKLSIPAASNVNLSGPFRDVAAGPVTPRKVCGECDRIVFAAGLCATHLTQPKSGEPSTPTSLIRKMHNLWSRTVEPAQHLSLRWDFWKKGEKYAVVLWEDAWSLERTVLVNGTVTYRGAPQEIDWRLSMVLGRSKSSAFEVILGALPKGAPGTGEMIAGWQYDSTHEFELWIDGFPFTEARNNFLSELGAQRAMQLEAEGGSSDAHDRLYEDLKYIQSNWSKRQNQQKTSMGYRKNIVEWRFTLKGRKHTLILTHSETSGKRVLVLDDRQILVKKPGLLSGLLLKRSASHSVQLEGVQLEVRIRKMDWTHVERTFGQTAAQFEEQHPNFSYELFVDRVAFSRCMKTLQEYAGGDTLIEDKLSSAKAADAKRKKREAELKRDPRALPSPEPIEDPKI